MPVALTGAAVVVWLLALARIDVSNVGDLGLISAVGPLYFAALILLAVGFVTALKHPSRRILLGMQVLALVLMVHGTAGIVESEPRFPSAWVHAGFTDFIARTGRLLPDYDARFSWPGFFSLAALVTRVGDLPSPVVLLRWAPLLFNLLYLAPVAAIARTFTEDRRARWLALWLFVLGNWVGQDYFSPQAFAYFLFLVFCAVVLRWFRTTVPSRAAGGGGSGAESGPAEHRWGLRRLLSAMPDELAPVEASPSQRVLLMAVLLAVYAVMVVSHQLSPVILLLGMTALVVAGRCRLRAFPVLMGVLLAAWVSYGTVAYWSGHLGDLFGSLGRLGTAFSANVSNRLEGSEAHRMVVSVRIGLAGTLCVLALAGFLRRLRTGHGDLTFALLAASPFPVVVLQSYGGEALLRAYLFALPFLALFGSSALLPWSRPEWAVGRRLVVAALSIAIVPVFLVARYGNERFEMVTQSERNVFEFVAETVPAGDVVFGIAPALPWPSEALERLDYRSPEHTLSDPAEVQRLMTGAGRPTYLVVTRGQEAYGELMENLPYGWARDLVWRLVVTGEYRVIFDNGDAKVVALVEDSYWEPAA